MILSTESGDLRQHAPVVYQETEGRRRTIPARYVLRGRGGVGFELARYDRGLPLLIDPVLSYSTFMGGATLDSLVEIAVSLVTKRIRLKITTTSQF